MPQRNILTKSTPAKPRASDLKEELLKWICERHATNEPLDRQLLREKALSLATTFGVTGFKCSDAWLTMFLKKHGFSPSLTDCSGPTFPDYRVWVDLLRSLITQYRHKDLFSVDELVMYSDFVPARIFRKPHHQQQQQHGDQVSRPLEAFSASNTNRIGMLMCCNSSGTEKLGALISGPYQPVASRNDCRYHRDEGARINDDVFADWLSRLNRDMSQSDRKILLLLDRDRIRACQKAPRLSHVNLLYLPKDFPTQLRPLRGDVFHCVKMVYRSRYVEHILSNPDSRWAGDEIVDSIVRAWKSVGQELIVASFQRTKFREDESFLKIECPAWEKLGAGISFKKFVIFDDDLNENSHDALEAIEFGARHQYNLRNSSKGTVDLDDSATTRRDSKRVRERSPRRVTGPARLETSNREVQSLDQAQGSSGIARKRRVKKAASSEEDQRNSSDSRTTDEEDSSDEDARRQALMEEIQDFLEEDIPMKITIDIGETPGGNEITSNFIKVPQDQSESAGDPRTSRVVSGDHEEKFHVENTEADGCLGCETIEEVVSNSKAEERASRTTEQDEPLQNFPGEQPGPSGEGLYARAESFGARKPSSPVAGEFDDDVEESPDCRQLELKILDAIECCREIGRSEDDENSGEPGEDDDDDDDNRATCKRPGGERFADEEPPEKMARIDDGWSKRYETNFVFGPEVNGRVVVSQSVESSDVPSHEAVVRSKKTQTRGGGGGGELEKRCIFTVDGGASAGVAFPATKD